MRHPASKQLFFYWNRLRGARPAPDRADFNPSAVAPQLADIFLLEPMAAELYRVRLAGSRLCALFGQELRGEPALNLVSPAAEADFTEMLAIVTGDTVPVIAGISALLPDGQSLPGEMLLLPLIQGGHSSDRLLGSVTFPPALRRPVEPCVGLDILSFRVLNEAEIGNLPPPAPDLPIDVRHLTARRGHLTILDGGLR
jgi:hypothetical protein